MLLADPFFECIALRVGKSCRPKVSATWRGLQADSQQLVASDLKVAVAQCVVHGEGSSQDILFSPVAFGG